MKRSDGFKENVLLVIIGVTLFWALFNYNLIFGLIRWTVKILAPFLTGAALALILNVPMSAIERILFKSDKDNCYTRAAAVLKRPVSLLLTYLIFFGVIVLVLCLVIPELIEAVTQLSADLPEFIRSTGSKIQNNKTLSGWLEEMNIDLDRNEIAARAQSFLQDGGLIIRTVNSTVSAASGFISGLINFVVGIFFSIYILLQKERLKNQMYRLSTAFLPEKHSIGLCRICRLSKNAFSAFLSGQCIEAMILGSLCCIGMTIFRFPNAVTVGILVAVTAFIPIVGGIIGIAVGAFFIMVTDLRQALWFIVFMMILQQFEGNVIYPKVVGGSVGLPPLWVLFAVTVGGALGGIAGMFIGVPVCSVLYCLIKETVDHINKRKGVYEPPPPVLNVVSRRVRVEEATSAKGKAKSYKNKKTPPETGGK